MADIAASYRDYAREFNQLAAELAEIDSYRNVVDPATGEAAPEPVYRLQGQQRVWREERLASLNYAMNLLQTDDGELGPEARHRLDAAMRKSVQARVELKRALEDKAKVEQLSVERLREQRIEEQVARRVRMMGGR